MSEFLTPGQLASLPVAVALVTVIVNVLRKSLSFNPSWVALAISLVYAVVVFVWPIPAPAATTQDWAIRIVMAVIAAFMITGGASDISGRLAVRNSNAQTRGVDSKPPFSTRWY